VSETSKYASICFLDARSRILSRIWWGFYPECEGAHLHIILDTTPNSRYYINSALIFPPLTFESNPASIDPFQAQVVESAEAY
jgi:hypothetical protein